MVKLPPLSPGTFAKFEKVEETPNIFWVGNAGFEADNDRVIVLQDEYRSGLECPRCLDKNKHTQKGREVSTISCPDCNGKGERPKVGNPAVNIKCSWCVGDGWIPCPECNGKGGTIILAENAKGRPTTGTIVSVGPDIKNREIGQRVIYPSFSGHAYDLKKIDEHGAVHDVVLVILRSEEILSRMYGSLEQTAVKRSEARYTNA